MEKLGRNQGLVELQAPRRPVTFQCCSPGVAVLRTKPGPEKFNPSLY